MDNFNQNNLQNGTGNGASQPQQPNTAPNTPTVKPQQPSANPYNAPVQPQQPSANPYNAPVQPQQPTANPYNAPVQPTQPTPNPYNAPVQPPRPTSGNYTQPQNGQYNAYTQSQYQQANSYQQANYANAPVQPVDDADSKGTAPMVLGIVALVASVLLCGFAPLAIIPGIIGLVMGIRAKGSVSGRRSGKAVAGIITSCIGIAVALFWIVVYVLVIFGMSTDSDFWREYNNYYGNDSYFSDRDFDDSDLSDMSVENVRFSDGQVIVNVK